MTMRAFTAWMPALLLGCAPKAPPPPPPPPRVDLPANYKPISLTELARPLPPTPEPCRVGTRQLGPVITELVACGDRGVTRVMILPSSAPDKAEMLAMADQALAQDGQVVRIDEVGFPFHGRALDANRLLLGEEGPFIGLAVVHPEAPWPELLTCSALQPFDSLEAWCAAAIDALLLPDDPARLAPPAQR